MSSDHYRRMLFIGLGGSGGKTLRFLKRDLEEWLDSVGWIDKEGRSKGIPQGIHFLHIDTPTTADGLEAGGGSLSGDEYQGLVAPGMTLKALMSSLDRADTTGESLAGWRVDESRVKLVLTSGAGQMRAIGRSVSRVYAGQIKEGLDGAISAMSAEASRSRNSDLDSLYDHVHKAQPKTSASSEAPITVFVSSLAGGTGAGLMFEVADIYRSIRPDWAENSVGIWYTPDVFPTKFGRGLRPNSLAALSELLNGAWWKPQSGAAGDASIPRRSISVLGGTAGLSNGLERSGVDHNFLVGTVNVNGVTMESEDGRLFEKVGGALLSWVTDPILQGNLKSYAFGNSTELAQPEVEDFPWNFGNAGESPSPVFNSLGFARVSLGTRYFRDYAAERIGKRVIVHLTEAHDISGAAESARKELGTTDPVRIVQHLVEQQLPPFRDVMDVRKRLETDREGPKRRIALTTAAATTQDRAAVASALADVLLESLTPSSLKATIQEQVQDLARMTSGVGASTLAEWLDRLRHRLDNHVRDALEQRVKSDLPAEIMTWSKDATEQFPQRVEDEIGKLGLHFAAKLLESFSSEIKNLVIPELKQRAIDYASWGRLGEAERDFRTELDVLPEDDRKISPEDPKFDTALTSTVETIAYSAKAIIAARAELLMERFRIGMVIPLAESLSGAYQALLRETPTIEDWPEWVDEAQLPKHLAPPLSDITVLDPNRFGRIFRGLLNHTFLQDLEKEAEAKVTSEVASATFARKGLVGLPASDERYRSLSGVTLLHVNQSWMSGQDLDQSGFAPTPIGVEVRITVDDVRRRTLEWLMRPNYPFENYLSLNLATYTQREIPGVEAQGVRERQSMVVDRLRQAIAAAAPLVELYAESIGSIHDNMKDPSKRFELLVSKVPFAGTPIEQEIRDLLRDQAFKGAENVDKRIKEVMSQSSELPHIDVVSFLTTPVSPVTVKTLLEPIANQWGKARVSARDKSAFWLHRRARPLGEFVPLPQAHLHAALRGWFTGRMLGLIEAGDTLPYRVLAGAGDINPRWLDFPDTFLSKNSSGNDKSALVLEALAIAIVHAPSTRNASLAPYLELVKLGMSEPTGEGSVFAYPRLNPVLANWIRDGRLNLRGSVMPEPGPGILATVADEPIENMSPDQRRALASKFIEGNRAAFEAEKNRYFDEQVQVNRNVLNEPPLWPGMWEQLNGAHLALLKAVREHRTTADSGNDGGARMPVD